MKDVMQLGKNSKIVVVLYNKTIKEITAIEIIPIIEKRIFFDLYS